MALSNFGPLFYQADQKYHLQPGTTGSIGYIESHYNPNAVSPAGAQGLMQFMPQTARGMGLSNPFDPASSIDAGAHLFRQNLDASNGDYRQAAEMYHGGPNQSIWGPKTNAYGDNFMSRLGSVNPSAQPSAQPGGQPPMPPRTPPMSLGAMMGQQAPVNMGVPPPVNTDVMGTSSLVPQGNSLGAMAQGMPQMPTKAPSKFTAGNILGTLGDALSAYGGRAPTFGPFLREQAMMDKQQGFEREKFQQELAMRMYAMTHPQDMMDGIAFANAPKDVQQAMVYRENALHPTVAGVQQPNGSVINTVIPRQLPPQVGEVQDGHRFLGGDPANPQAWEAVQ